MNSKLKNRFFSFTVKTPGAAFSILFITLVSLFLIISIAEVDQYAQVQGEFYFDDVQNKYYIQALVDKKDVNKIGQDTHVIWYLNPEAQRYETTIFEIKVLEEDAQVLIEVDAEQDKIGQTVNVEIFQKKVKVIHKIFKSCD